MSKKKPEKKSRASSRTDWPQTLVRRCENYLQAIGWKDYKIDFQPPKPAGEGPGLVFWAVDRLNKPIAIKTLPITHTDLPEGRETEVIKRIYSEEEQGTCPFIPQRKGFTTYENQLFLAMEHVEYSFWDLQRGIDERKFTLEEKIGAFINYADCLDYLHDTIGVAHRDIKPAHLRFQLNGQKITPKIIDIGLACFIDDSISVMGTVGYKPPETERQGGLGDIFSLGVCLYEAIHSTEKSWRNQTTQLTQQDTSLQTEHKKIKDSQVLSDKNRQEEIQKATIRKFHSTKKPIGKTRFLVEIVKKATQPEAGDRYTTAAEMRADLHIALDYKRMEEITLAFEEVNSLADAINASFDFKLDTAKKAAIAKNKFYMDLNREGIDTKKSHLIRVFEQDLKERLKPIKNAVRNYLKMFRITQEHMSGETSMTAMYQAQVDAVLKQMNPTVRRNVYVMSKQIQELYKICGLKTDILLDVLLTSRTLKIEAASKESNKSLNELIQTVDELPSDEIIILEDGNYDPISRAVSRANHYLDSLESKEPTATDLQHCIELKKAFENNPHNAIISPKISKFFDKIQAYESRVSDETIQEMHFKKGLTAFAAANYDDAVSHFEEAAKIGPQNPNITFNMGCAMQFTGSSCNYVTGKYRNSRELRKSAGKSESIKILNNIAVIYASNNQQKDALAALQIAVKEDPADFESNYNLGRICIEQNRPAEAIEHLEKALSINPLSELHNFLAQAHFQAGNLDKAKEHGINYVKSLSGRLQ
ncbi:tetratricopeptide repeat protein [Candidatus Woesearchaeota archaeon]|nr:tetratricopeptide repeat protein [Candidatus Woesearchaeota archaeon]